MDASNNAPDCSVVVPVKNEAGNIARAFRTIPALGLLTEVIFVCGESHDGTWGSLAEHLGNYDGPHRVIAMAQQSAGKWGAVREGFDAAQGKTLIILDGDLTVHPRELTQFYEQAAPGVFLMGTRLIYPMEPGAMRKFNFVGNVIFAAICSIVVKCRLTDSLCGVKSLQRDDWIRMRESFPDLIERDPFGDHALLYGASRLGLSIREIPVHYLARTYGETQIRRFSDGWRLLRLAVWEIWQSRFGRC